MTTLNGIDVSNYQGPAFDWAAWRGRISFAGIKISEGTAYADPDAARNVQQARAGGIVPMGYHFLHAGSSAAAQAAWFTQCAKAAGIGPGDLVAVDAEQGGLDGLSAAALWLAAEGFSGYVITRLGPRPVVYTDISLAASAASSLGLNPLWLANPSGTPVTAIGPWKLVSFEQTGQSGTDTDVFYGDLAALAKLAIPAATPPPAPAAKWPTGVTLAYGSAGAAVEALQEALRDSGIHGVRGIAVDGEFGEQTQTATRNFEAAEHLTVDAGIAGPEVRAALIRLGRLTADGEAVA